MNISCMNYRTGTILWPWLFKGKLDVMTDKYKKFVKKWGLLLYEYFMKRKLLRRIKVIIIIHWNLHTSFSEYDLFMTFAFIFWLSSVNNYFPDLRTHHRWRQAVRNIWPVCTATVYHMHLLKTVSITRQLKHSSVVWIAIDEIYATFI